MFHSISCGNHDRVIKMAYKLNMGSWNSVFAVPRELISKHLKLCSENELKFILWLFANPETEFNNESISKATGIPLSSVEDCLEYWLNAKLIKVDLNEITAVNSTVITKTVEPVAVNKEQPMQRMLRPDGIYIAKRLKESATLAHLFEDVQNILGKMISPSLSAVLVIAHDDYCLPCEVLLMLISYCESIEKTSTGFIEGIAKKWYNKGVLTLELAEQELKELDEKSSAWKKLVSVLDLTYRKPIKTEEELAVFAVIEAKFSDEMLQLCYQKCIEGTGKFQAKYMLKILKSWNDKKLRTVIEVQTSESINKQNKVDNSRDTSYDLNEFHRLNLFNLEEE